MGKNYSNDIFIYPTDTVWGIGACIYSQEANELVRSKKRNEANKPLSILFSSFQDLSEYIEFPKAYSNKLKSCFELEFTLLLPLELLKKQIPPHIVGESDFVGVRVLQGSLFSELTQLAGGPVTTTSLNLSGEASIISKERAESFLHSYAPEAKFLYDESISSSGESSTIICLTPDRNLKVIRRGRYCDEVLDRLNQIDYL